MDTVMNQLVMSGILFVFVILSDITLNLWANCQEPEDRRAYHYISFLITTFGTFPFLHSTGICVKESIALLQTDKHTVAFALAIAFSSALAAMLTLVKVWSLPGYFSFAFELWYAPQIKLEKKRFGKNKELIREQCKTFEDVDKFLVSEGCSSEEEKQRYLVKKYGLWESKCKNGFYEWDYKKTVEKLLENQNSKG